MSLSQVAGLLVITRALCDAPHMHYLAMVTYTHKAAEVVFKSTTPRRSRWKLSSEQLLQLKKPLLDLGYMQLYREWLMHMPC